MAKSISSLSVGLFGDIAPFAGAMKSAGEHVGSFVGKVEGMGSRLLEMTGIAAAAGAAFGAVFEIGKGFKLASDLEQAQVAFETILGSAAAAKQVLGDLSKFAAETPFQLPELVSASKSLIAFGVSASDLMPDLKEIGDVASGISAPIGEIAQIFGKVQVAGKLTGETLRQLQEHGVPISKALAAQFGVPQSAIGKMVEESQVGAAQFNAAFKSMTGPGGQFAGMMEKQSHTVGGLMSTLRDSVDMSLAGVATTIIDVFNLRGAIAAATRATDKIGGAITGFVARVAPTIKSVALAAYETVADLYARVQPVLGAVWRVAEYVWGGIYSTVTAYGGAIRDAAAGAWDAIYNAVTPIVSGLGTFIGDNWRSVLSDVVTVGAAFWDYYSSLWTMAAQAVGTAWGAIVDFVAWGGASITGDTESTGENVRAVFHEIVDWGHWLADSVQLTLGMVSYAFDNWRAGVEIAGLSVAAAVVKAGNVLEYTFTTVIPYAANYAWVAFKDFAFNTVTAFENLGGNVLRFFVYLPELISGKMHFADIWQPIGDGMRDELAKIPPMAARQAGALETSLLAERDKAIAALPDIGEYLAGKQAKAKSAAAKVAGAITGAIAAAKPIEPPKVKPPAVPKPEPLRFDAKIDPQNLALDVTPQVKLAKAVRSGSAEAQLLRFAVGAPSGPAAGGLGTGPLAAAGKALGSAVVARAAPAPLAAPAPPAAVAASLPAAAATAVVAAGKEAAGAGPGQDLLKHIDGYWLQRIEQNTRAAAVNVVSI